MMDGGVLIGGRWQAPASGATLPVVNPSDGEIFTKIARGAAEDVDRAVRAAHKAMDGAWGRMPAVERGRLLT
ncbi:MAG: aldehyde dehydrogenase family protein, partial [Rhodospirillaceae bacterium]|nr:aldehyde dehydrogenase family protein [Rhodospirillaceae bacterium]